MVEKPAGAAELADALEPEVLDFQGQQLQAGLGFFRAELTAGVGDEGGFAPNVSSNAEQ